MDSGAFSVRHTVPATTDGHMVALQWPRSFGTEVSWAVEDVRIVTRRRCWSHPNAL